MMNPPNSFLYDSYAFLLKDIDDLTLRVSKRRVHKYTYQIFSVIEVNEKTQYKFLETFPINDAFKVYFATHYLVNTKWTLQEIRTNIFIGKDDDNAIALAHFYLIEEDSFLEPFKDEELYQPVFTKTSSKIMSKINVKTLYGDYNVSTNSSVILSYSNYFLYPLYKIYQVKIYLNIEEAINTLVLTKIIISILEKFIHSNMGIITKSNIIFSKSFFIDQLNPLKYNIRLYMFPKIMNDVDFFIFNPRFPIINSISSLYNTPVDGNIISFLLNTSYIPLKKLSIPIKIHKIESNFNEPIQILKFIETNIVYRELILDRKNQICNKMFFGKKKDETQRVYFSKYKSLIYSDQKTRYDKQEQIFYIFRKNIFQRWKDVEIEFIVDGPSLLGDKNGIECFQSMIDDAPILSQYSWLIVASYNYSKSNTSRFVAVAIPKFVIKQKFKDLTIGEGGITPFWISS